MKENLRKLLAFGVLACFFIGFCLPFDLVRLIGGDQGTVHSQQKSSVMSLLTASSPFGPSNPGAAMQHQQAHQNECSEETAPSCCHTRPRCGASSVWANLASACDCGHSNETGQYAQRLALPVFFSTPLVFLKDARFGAAASESQTSPYCPTIDHPPCVIA